MSGRPRSCVTKLQINIIKARPLLFHVRHMSFVRILDYRDPLPPPPHPPPPHPPPHHHRHRALEGERRGPGIYKRQCNREKTRTWPPGCTQPMARPCRFLHKTTFKSFCIYVIYVLTMTYWPAGTSLWPDTADSYTKLLCLQIFSHMYVIVKS